MMGDGSASTTVDMLDPGEEIEGTHDSKPGWFHRHLEPHSKILRVWQILVVLSVMNTIFLDTFMWSFDSRILDLWALVYVMDAIYIINIALKFYTAYYERGIVITDSAKIRRHYLKTTFFVDLITIMPLELVALAPTFGTWRYVAVFRCNRLIRLYAVFQFYGKYSIYKNKQASLNMPSQGKLIL